MGSPLRGGHSPAAWPQGEQGVGPRRARRNARTRRARGLVWGSVQARSNCPPHRAQRRGALSPAWRDGGGTVLHCRRLQGSRPRGTRGLTAPDAPRRWGATTTPRFCSEREPEVGSRRAEPAWAGAAQADWRTAWRRTKAGHGACRGARWPALGAASVILRAAQRLRFSSKGTHLRLFPRGVWRGGAENRANRWLGYGEVSLSPSGRVARRTRPEDRPTAGPKTRNVCSPCGKGTTVAPTF